VTDLQVPFDFRRGSDELQYTYLDTIGRPVIVLSKSNLVDVHIQDFKLRLVCYTEVSTGLAVI